MTAGMETCQRCRATRIVSISAKVSDRFCASMDVDDGTTYGKPVEYDGYVPRDMGLGRGGDYLDIVYCLTCGQIQADPGHGIVFPVPPCKMEDLDEEA
jgi:hypothetical protein